MRAPLTRRLSIAVALACLVAAIHVQVDWVEAYGVDDPAFARVWERTDHPVVTDEVQRTWMWGPEAFTHGFQEPYGTTGDGTRLVQYFDKSRMEITDPDADPRSPWYVTNGLLVVEMVTGNLQQADDRFSPREPAQVNVAGDADDPTGPTYATFGQLAFKPPLPHGSTIVQRVTRDGVVSDDPALKSYGVTAGYLVNVPGIRHEIASVFWEFMNSTGLVYDDGDYVLDLLFENPFYATGYPISEAYWAPVKVGGTQKDVLMQCFERRCLTYTPDNPSEWRVEAGNVGQHYYRWRYGDAAPGSRYDFAVRWGAPWDVSTRMGDVRDVVIDNGGDVIVLDAAPVRLQYYTREGYLLRQVTADAWPAGTIVSPAAMDLDGAGNVYVADGDRRAIVKLDASGSLVETWAFDTLFEPADIAIADDDAIFVLDTGNGRVIRLDTDGNTVTSWAAAGEAIAAERGYVYVADETIRTYGESGQLLQTWSPPEPLHDPMSIDVDAEGIFYVIDRVPAGPPPPDGWTNYVIVKMRAGGHRLLTWDTESIYEGRARLAAGNGGDVWLAHPVRGIVHYSEDGAVVDAWADGSRGAIDTPLAMEFDLSGNLLVTDPRLYRIHAFDPEGAMTGSWGSLNESGNPMVWGMTDLAVGLDGRVYLASSYQVAVFDAPGGELMTFWDLSSPMLEDGNLHVQGIDVGPDGNVYVTSFAWYQDRMNIIPYAGIIQKYAPDGTLLLEWGDSLDDEDVPRYVGIAVHDDIVWTVDVVSSTVRKFGTDGTWLLDWQLPSDQRCLNYEGVGLDTAADGSLFIPAGLVLKLSPDASQFSTIGAYGRGDGEFENCASHVAVDPSGNLFVTDSGPYTAGRIQKFAPVP